MFMRLRPVSLKLGRYRISPFSLMAMTKPFLPTLQSAKYFSSRSKEKFARRTPFSFSSPMTSEEKMRVGMERSSLMHQGLK